MINENAMNRKFDITLAKKILQDIRDTFELNKENISKLIDEDNSSFAEKNSLDCLQEVISRVIGEKWGLEKSSKNSIANGIGTIGVICDGNLEVFFYMCLKAIKTNNRMLIFETKEIHKTAKFIISIIDEICKKYGYLVSIKIVEIDEYKAISKYDDSVDKYIIVGEQELFRRASIGIRKKVIYSAYGTVNLFLDDKSLEEVLVKIDDFVYDNDIKLNLYKGEDVQKIVEQINNSKEDYCSVIFSKDIEKIKVFTEFVNSEMIFINKNPVDEYKFTIDDLKFVRIKRIFL